MAREIKKEQRIVITGGGGFLGEAVYKKIRTEHPTVPVFFLLHKRVPDYVKNAPYTTYSKGDISPGTFYSGDIVIHLAGRTHAISEKDYFDINYLLTKKLAEMAQVSGVRLFIYASTRAVSDTHGGYGRSKYLAEEAIKKSGVPYIILRFAEIYGGNKNEGIDHFIKKSKTKKIIFYPSGGAPLAPIALFDAVYAIYAALCTPEAIGKIYTIAGPVSYSMKEMLRRLSQIFSRRLFFIPVPLFYIAFFIRTANLFGFKKNAPDQVSRFRAPKEGDISAATRDLLFVPASLEKGVKSLFL